MIYFDNAATTLKKPQCVINAVNYALKNLSANPGRSGHMLSEQAGFSVYNTRKNVADFFGASGPENVVFTLNCTQGINFVLKGVLKKGDHVVVSDMEHNAVMRPIFAMGVEYSQVNVVLNNDDETLENFQRAIKPNTKMIFCTAASNVVGKILPLKRIGELCKKNNILFAVDAAQAAGVLPINVVDMQIDYLCIAPHKGLYCPMGVGILIAEKEIKRTIIEGGTGTDSLNFKQPDNLPEMLESGTVNLPAIVAVSSGLDFIKSREKWILNYERSLIKRFYNGIKSEKIILYSNPLLYDCAPVLSFNIKGYNSDDVSKYLNKKGFALRSGLHCAPTVHKKIGTLSTGTVRFSPSIFNNYSEVDELIYTLKIFSKK